MTILSIIVVKLSKVARNYIFLISSRVRPTLAGYFINSYCMNSALITHLIRFPVRQISIHVMLRLISSI